MSSNSRSGLLERTWHEKKAGVHKTEAEPCSDEYWDACELSPRDRIREFQLTSLRRQLAYVNSSSPFYRKQWDEIGWNPADLRTLDDLAHLPFTRKADYAAALAQRPPWGALLACGVQGRADDMLIIRGVVEVVEPGVLPRTTHKATRVVRSPSAPEGAGASDIREHR